MTTVRCTNVCNKKIKMFIEKFCSCTDENLRAGCIVVSIWKMIGNGCLSVVVSGELHHSIPELRTGHSMLICCNLSGVLACFSLLYGAIQCSRIAIMLCLVFEMGEILLIFAYCALVLSYICFNEDVDLGIVEGEALFFILGFLWIAFWLFALMLFKRMQPSEASEKNILLKLKF
jgi:hypothetical protein